VEHKKRGRPPLKPEEATARRPFESALSPVSGPDPSRRLPTAEGQGYGPPSAMQRSIRPLPSYDPSRPSVRPGPPFQPIYATPTISPSPATAMGTFISSGRAFQPSTGMPPSQPPGYHVIQPSTVNPPGPQNYQGGYQYPPPHGYMPPLPPQQYSNPIFPRPPAPQATDEPPMGMYGSTSLQLPPIRPAPQGSHIDPAIAQQQRQHAQQHPREQQPGPDKSTREPDPKRPKMDIRGILGPRND